LATRIRTCFISALAGTPLDVLQDVLSKRNVRIVDPGVLSPVRDWAIEAQTLLASVDLVIGVVSRERRSEWMFFELGQAWAAGKQILLFAPPKSEFGPLALQRFLVVRANMTNREAIEFAIDQLLAASEVTVTAEAQKKTLQRAIGAVASDEFLDHATQLANRDAAASVTGMSLEKLVADTIRTSGVDTVVEGSGPDSGADLAVWADAFQYSIGNPLLIEIKARFIDRDIARNTFLSFSKRLADSGTRWGLVIYGEAAININLTKLAPPNVLALSLTELSLRLRGRSFVDVVKDLRNKRVHGVET
jgi:hypothetical protein